MLTPSPRRTVTLLVTGLLAGVTAAGCSGDAEPSPRLETASSPGGPAPSADSAAGRIDTASAPPPAESATTTPKTVAKPRRAAAKPATGATPVTRGGAAPGADAAAAADTATARRAGDSTPSPAAAAAPAAPAAQDQYLKYDPATNTVTFELIGGPRGFEFNGYTNGGATLILPSKANVVVNFINKDGTPHSAEVISGDGPIPNAGGDPAIPRAYTNQLLQGLPQEGTDVMRFQVPESGTYRIFCGVPGHGLSGMWIWMKVDPAAKTPSFGPTRA